MCHIEQVRPPVNRAGGPRHILKRGIAPKPMNAEPYFTRITNMRRVVVLALGLALCMPALAFAIVGGEGVDPDSLSSPWAGVGSVLTSNGT